MKERYTKTLEVVNYIGYSTRTYGIDPLDVHTVYKLYTNGKIKFYNNIASCAGYIVENDLHIIHMDKAKETIKPVINIVACISLDNEIVRSVYEILKDSPTQELIDYAFYEGHITFKQYNELYQKVKGVKV